MVDIDSCDVLGYDNKLELADDWYWSFVAGLLLTFVTIVVLVANVDDDDILNVRSDIRTLATGGGAVRLLPVAAPAKRIIALFIHRRATLLSDVSTDDAAAESDWNLRALTLRSCCCS